MIGKFATSKAGHDKTKLYIIIKEDSEYVYLVDGDLKPLDKPKKKRKKHVQMINRTVNEELLQRLRENEKVLDEEIKYEIKHYYQ